MIRTPAPRAVVVDVDGVVSAVNPSEPTWGDEVVVGNVFGPVRVSPTLCERLDDLASRPGVRCWWLTSWTVGMRADMETFPGRDWPVIVEQSDMPAAGVLWWKLAAVEQWLDSHPEIGHLAWCDDHLRGGRPSAVRRRVARHVSPPLLITPRIDRGADTRAPGPARTLGLMMAEQVPAENGVLSPAPIRSVLRPFSGGARFGMGLFSAPTRALLARMFPIEGFAKGVLKAGGGLTDLMDVYSLGKAVVNQLLPTKRSLATGTARWHRRRGW